MRTFSFAFVIALAACSARGGGGGGGGFSDDASTATDTPVVAPGTCTTICARVAMTSGCSADTASCMTGCSTLLSAPGCSAEVSAFASCAQSSGITCSGDTPNFTSCTAQQAALISCISMPRPDASVSVDAAPPPDVVVRPDVTTQPDVIERPDIISQPDASPAALCERVCATLATTPGCSGVSCSGMCSLLSSLPASCTSTANSFLACAAGSTPTCSGGNANYPACASLQDALLRCLGITPDAGVDATVDTGPTGSITSACTTATWGGTTRECGWRSAGTFSCTPGSMVTVGCNSTAGSMSPCTSTLGACSGDPVLRVCSGTTACSSSTAIGSVDDTCGTCPVATVVCPSTGRISVYTGDYSDSTPGSCTVSTR